MIRLCYIFDEKFCIIGNAQSNERFLTDRFKLLFHMHETHTVHF